MKKYYSVPELSTRSCKGCCFDNDEVGSFKCNHPGGHNKECSKENVIFKFKEEKVMSDKKQFKAGDKVILNDYSLCMVIDNGNLHRGGWNISKPKEKLIVVEIYRVKNLETGLFLPIVNLLHHWKYTTKVKKRF